LIEIALGGDHDREPSGDRHERRGGGHGVVSSSTPTRLVGWLERCSDFWRRRRGKARKRERRLELHDRDLGRSWWPTWTAIDDGGQVISAASRASPNRPARADVRGSKSLLSYGRNAPQW